MIDTAKLKEAVDQAVSGEIRSSLKPHEIEIVSTLLEAARLVLAAQAAPGEVEAVARALHEAHKPWCDYTYAFEDPMAGREIYEVLARAALLAAALHRPVEARVTEEMLPMMSALLRIVYQSFDAGGESSRSMRAQALEAVLFNISDNDNPAFGAARRECDADPYAFISKARLALSDARAAPAHASLPSPQVTRGEVEKAYALLWRETVEAGGNVSRARSMLLEFIGKDGQRRGLEWAHQELGPR